ncbi:hypothetical protein ACFQLX_06445 [Streptomyces polyrhachis]|uniref:Cellulose synthase n=1 Tax=Streptomyces polyrhachis TaxID=1282885 RepID=A0ABW2GD71_9ACTN
MFTTTVCAALSAAGLAVALLTAYRRRFRRAVRIAAVSLLPVGLAMAGLVDLGREVGTAVGGWAADLVLKPTVWAGFAVLALSVVLYAAARIGAGRTPGRRERAARSRPGSTAVDTTAKAPALGSSRAAQGQGRNQGQDQEDFSDIEKILKKHGI